MLNKPSQFPSIDYARHPAFSTFPTNPRIDETWVDERVVGIDQGLSHLGEASFGTERDLERAYDDEVRRQAQSLAAYLVERTDNPALAGMIATSIGRATDELLIELKFNQRRKTGSGGRKPRASIVADELESDGVCLRQIPPALWREMKAAAAPYMAELREKARSNPQGRNVVNLKRKMWLWYLLERAFAAEGFEDGLSGYMRIPMEFAGGSIEYSHAGQTWWRGCYADIGLSESRTAYMHFDYGHDTPKAMVMLCDVDVANGATSFVPGSHRWARSEFAFRLHHVLDYVYADAIRDGLIKVSQAVGTYNRPRFKDPALRGQLILLPARMRGSSHFGDDVLDGSAQSDALLAGEVTVTTDVGNMALFDGARLIHRGSLVREGERFAMQIIFQPKASEDRRPTLKTAIRRPLNALKYAVTVG